MSFVPSSEAFGARGGRERGVLGCDAVRMGDATSLRQAEGGRVHPGCRSQSDHQSAAWSADHHCRRSTAASASCVAAARILTASRAPHRRRMVQTWRVPSWCRCRDFPLWEETKPLGAENPVGTKVGDAREDAPKVNLACSPPNLGAEKLQKSLGVHAKRKFSTKKRRLCNSATTPVTSRSTARQARFSTPRGWRRRQDGTRSAGAPLSLHSVLCRHKPVSSGAHSHAHKAQRARARKKPSVPDPVAMPVALAHGLTHHTAPLSLQALAADASLPTLSLSAPRLTPRTRPSPGPSRSSCHVSRHHATWHSPAARKSVTIGIASAALQCTRPNNGTRRRQAEAAAAPSTAPSPAAPTAALVASGRMAAAAWPHDSVPQQHPASGAESSS